MKVLLTGGMGYIGSHTAVELIQGGYDVVIADNLSNSDPSVLDRIAQITAYRPAFYQIDVADCVAVQDLFSKEKIDAVIHFAGLKSVGESVEKPLLYYRNNLDTTLTLLEVMAQFGCSTFVFSSSATVYGLDNPSPYRENMPTGNCSNPYGWTKHMIEQILRDAARANPALSVVLLRYFNPIGAHESGLLGDSPTGIPNNLMPYITQTAAGIRPKLFVFGNDYPTPDGTGVRDYIHVVDLARGHVAALHYAQEHVGAEAVNLGTGSGYSVMQVIQAFEEANHLQLPYEMAPRRAGDLASYYAHTEKAEQLLSWHAEKNLEDMCRDSWRWESTRQKLENNE